MVDSKTNPTGEGGRSPSPCSLNSCPMAEDGAKWADHYKSERDQMVEEYREAVAKFAGTLHCRPDCECANRKILNKLESILPENAEFSQLTKED